MPAIALTSVDLPAPLSPTSATTSPAWTSKFTSESASTGPNLLLTPLNVSRAPLVLICRSFRVAAQPGAAAAAAAPRARSGQVMPADLHADGVRRAVQICDAVQKPSLTIVSLMLSLVTATGVRITDGTLALAVVGVPG